MVAQEKAEHLDPDALIKKWIEPNSHRWSSGRARVKKYGISVWALVGLLQGVDGDVAAVTRAYDIPVEVVQAALAYYERHRVVIDGRIAENKG